MFSSFTLSIIVSLLIIFVTNFPEISETAEKYHVWKLREIWGQINIRKIWDQITKLAQNRVRWRATGRPYRQRGMHGNKSPTKGIGGRIGLIRLEDGLFLLHHPSAF